MGRNQYSDDERARRSERAKELVRQGKWGGSQYGRLGGRPRKQRASELVAQAAEKHASKITQVFEDAIQEGVPIRDRLAAADKWLQVEQREEVLRQAEERALEGLHRDKLIEELTGTLERLALAGAIPEVIEGVALELPPVESNGTHEVEMPDD